MRSCRRLTFTRTCLRLTAKRRPDPYGPNFGVFRPQVNGPEFLKPLEPLVLELLGMREISGVVKKFHITCLRARIRIPKVL